MSKLYLLVGLPGIGKTTYAKQRLGDAVRVSHDDIYRMISGEWRSEWRPIYHNAEDAIVSFALEHGFDVVVDRTNMTRESRKRFIELGKAHQATITALVFLMDLELAIDRNVTPERVSADTAVPPAVIRGMYDEYQEPYQAEGFDGIYLIDPRSYG